VAHRLALIAHGGAEIITAAADPSWKELFVDHPIGKPFFVARNNLGTLGAKSGSEIFVAKRYRILFDVTVGIDDAHGKDLASGIYL